MLSLSAYSCREAFLINYIIQKHFTLSTFTLYTCHADALTNGKHYSSI